MQKMVISSTLGACPRANIFNLGQSSTHRYLIPFEMPLIVQDIIPTRLKNRPLKEMCALLQYHLKYRSILVHLRVHYYPVSGQLDRVPYFSIYLHTEKRYTQLSLSSDCRPFTKKSTLPYKETVLLGKTKISLVILAFP